MSSFNFQRAIDCLDLCVQGQLKDGDYPAEAFCTFQEELVTLFKSIGSIFEFVFSKLSRNIEVLRMRTKEFQELCAGLCFSMINEEVRLKVELLDSDNNKLADPKYKSYHSFTVSFVQMARFLKFLSVLLAELLSSREDKVSDCCKRAYSQTISKYHNFFMRQGFKICMLGAPDRELLKKQLLGRSDASDEEFYKAIETMRSLLDSVTTGLLKFL